MSQFIPIQVPDYSSRIPPPAGAPPTGVNSVVRCGMNNLNGRFYNQYPSASSTPAKTPNNSSPATSASRGSVPALSRGSSTTVNSRSQHVARPTNQQPPQVYFRRVSPDDNDVIISCNGIHHNVKKITQGFSQHGNPYKTETVRPPSFDFKTELSKMSPGNTKNFWNSNWVDIAIKLDGFTKKGTKGDMGEMEQGLRRVLDNLVALTKINSGFVSHAKRIRVLIYFAPEVIRIPIKSIKASPEYGMVKELVDKLGNLPSLGALQVHIRSPAASPSHISNERLTFILPFYTLSFTDWTIKHHIEGTPTALFLPRFFQNYLNNEARKEKDEEAGRVIATTVSQVTPISWKDLPLHE